MKAYLDNNIVGAIAKDDHPAESDPLDRLLKAKDEGKVDLVTSELTLAEIKRYQDTLLGMHSYGDERTWITTPFIENHPEYGALLALGLDVIDAQHVYVAGKQVCDTFLTCDGDILRRAVGIKNIFPSLAVQKPSQLVVNRGW
jgi:hypothetical protein